MVLGAHVSIAGGVRKAPQNGLDLGCEAIQIFSKNQRQWKAKPYAQEEIQAFRENYRQSGLKGVLVHGSYLVNVASPDPALWKKSRDALLDEAQRCEQLGIPYLSIHPGSHLDSGVRAGVQRIAEAIAWVLDETKGSRVEILLESMAGQGSNIGARFEDLSEIRKQAGGSRVGYCFDTCHLYAAGFDITTPAGYQNVMKLADDVLGLSHIKAFHLNDSKSPLGSHVDRHANIGKGFLKAKGFQPLLQDPRFRDAPMVLETPLGDEGYRADLKALRSLRRLL